MLSRLPLVAGHDRLAVGLGRVQPGLKCQPMTLVISRRLGLVFGHTAARWQTAAASAERPGGQLASSSAGRRLGHQAQPPRRAEPVLRLRRFHPVGQRCGCEAWGTHRQPPRRSLTSDGCIDHQLPGLQRCQCLLALGTRLIQAMREQKLIGAGRLRRTEPSRHRRALGASMVWRSWAASSAVKTQALRLTSQRTASKPPRTQPAVLTSSGCPPRDAPAPGIRTSASPASARPCAETHASMGLRCTARLPARRPTAPA